MRKNTLLPTKVISAGDLSTNLTSPVTNIQFLDNVLIQLIATGTPTGFFSVEVSNDYSVNEANFVTNAGSWVSLPLVPAPTLSGSGDIIILDLNQLGAPWIRVSYTATAGVGALDMYITGKMI